MSAKARLYHTMAEQTPSFTYNYLEHKLRERLEEALVQVNALSQEAVLQCDDECLKQLVARFTITPPILRLDKRVIDERTFELVDDTFEHKTGDTGHRILIPIEGDHEWLTEVDMQKTPGDDHYLAFLDKERRWVFINLQISPEDEEGILARDASYRTRLVDEYVTSVGTKLAAFNTQLAAQMKSDLQRRNQAIVKARRERDMLGLAAVDNPRNEETARKMERLRQQLINRMSHRTSNEERSSEPELDIAHVLFMDIVGYSKLAIDLQTVTLHRLQEKVQRTKEFVSCQQSDRLISLPTGDGMALAFFGDPLAPVKCAIELSRSLRASSEIPLRMGLSSGPTYRITDINANPNVAGDGINMAQRVMDCGDAGHILISKRVADDLLCVTGWEQYLHDLGEVEVKHGKRIHIFNLCSFDFGNGELPKKVSATQAASGPPNLNM